MSSTAEKTKLMMYISKLTQCYICQLHFNKMEVGTEATLQENRCVVPEQPLAWNSKAE